MLKKLTALLVSDGGKPFEELALALDNQGITTSRAGSGAEALMRLEQADSPQMIFTDTAFPDGTWADILELAAPHSVPVILVSRWVDLDLYVHSLERGAFDFIVPPFMNDGLAHVVKCAAWNRSNRPVRKASAAV